MTSDPTPQAQARSTCPVCGGAKILEGRLVRDLGDMVMIVCPNCEDGTVPAGDLAQWREMLQRFLDEEPLLRPGSISRHLAAMPAKADPNVVMLRVLKAVEEGLAAIEPEFQAGPLVVVRTMQGSVRAAIAQAEKRAAG